MNTLYFSPSAGGFFSSALHGTDMPADALEISDQEYAALVVARGKGQMVRLNANGRPEAVQAVADPTDAKRMLLAAVSRRIETAARERGYDSMATAVSYADEPAVPAYQAEGAALRAWRSLVWSAALAQLEATLLPTPHALLASLPALELPL